MDVEADVETLLEGKGLPLDLKQIDFGNDKAEAFKPVTKRNIGYIVSAVLINEQGQILMMQEAKYTCYGSWYLPAGRVEPGENFRDAVKREVKEETGLEFEPTTLVSVEMGCGTWFRFNFTGKVTGGKLKTLDGKDKESLQAEWIDWENIKNKTLKLRATDIIPLIKRTRQYVSQSQSQHICCMPALHPYSKLVHRALIVHCYWDSDINILVINKDQPRIPNSYISPYDASMMVSVFAILKNAFGTPKNMSVKLCGVITLEHDGSSETDEDHDGLCITSLIQLDADKICEPPKTKDGPYIWIPLKDKNPSLNEKIRQRLQDNMVVPLINI